MMSKDKDEIALLSEIMDKNNRETRENKVKIGSLQTSVKLHDARFGQIEENIKNIYKHISTLSCNDETLSSNIATVQNDSALEINKVRNELKNVISPGQEPKKIVRVNSRARV